MADQRVRVRILADASQADRELKQTARGFQRFNQTVGAGLTKAFTIAGAAAAAFGFALSKVVGAANRNDEAIAKLDAATLRYGNTADIVSKQLQAQAAALERVTRFSDESVIGAQALLATLGVQAGQMEQATQATVDLAAAFGISLESAARNVGRTMGGFAGELGELVPELKELSREALLAGEGIDLLAGKFAGRALEDAKTFSSAMDQLGNAFGSVTEALGEFVTRSERSTSAIKSLAETLQDVAFGLRSLRNEQQLTTEAGDLAAISAEALNRAMEREGLTAQQLADRIGVTVDQVKRWTDASKDAGVAQDDLKDDIEETNTSLADQAAAYRKAVEGARLFGQVTSIELEGKIFEINQSLADQRRILGENSREYQSLARVAGEQVTHLLRRIESLRDGNGDLLETTKDLTEAERVLTRERDTATSAIDRETAAILRQNEVKAVNAGFGGAGTPFGRVRIPGQHGSRLIRPRGFGDGSNLTGTFTTIRPSVVTPDGKQVYI